MQPIKFSKYQGTGNDFIIIDARSTKPDLSQKLISDMCNRHYGIGADGLMTLETDPAGLDFYMRYWNSDGIESTMCGNGGRCISLFAHHLGIGSKVKKFNSSDGSHNSEITESNHLEGYVRLSMIDVERIIRIANKAYFTNTGSPHYVEFVENIDATDVCKFGREIRNSEQFRNINGVNVNFVEIIGNGHIKVRTYERGVENETLSCGTGATAAAIISCFVEQPSVSSYTVEVQGGNLCVSFLKMGEKFKNIELSGSVKKVFDGIYL